MDTTDDAVALSVSADTDPDPDPDPEYCESPMANNQTLFLDLTKPPTPASTPALTPASTPALTPASTPTSTQTSASTPVSNTKSAFYGSIPLRMPCDEDNLSPLHCFVRTHGIEAFVATEEEAQDSDFWLARNFKVKPGIVGMRCQYCSSKPLRLRGPKSIHYPSSTKCIYYSMENWQRHHAFHCSDVPKWVLRDLKNFMAKSKTGSGGRRRYWADSAKVLGMVDTPEGIRFQSNPEINAQIKDKALDGPESTTDTRFPIPTQVPLLKAKDDKHISDYLFLLMSQMEPCAFSEDDRTGSRSKIKNINIGYPGIQCRHCCGRAGVGRYFPVSLQNLTLANSDRNMHNHLKKCRRCPNNIKDKLINLRTGIQQPGRKIKRGARKTFFTQVWKRLHETADDKSLVSSTTSITTTESIMNDNVNIDSESSAKFSKKNKHTSPDQSSSSTNRPSEEHYTGPYCQETPPSKNDAYGTSNNFYNNRSESMSSSPSIIQVNTYNNNFSHSIVPALPIQRSHYHSMDAHRRWIDLSGRFNNNFINYSPVGPPGEFAYYPRAAGSIQYPLHENPEEANARAYNGHGHIMFNGHCQNFAQI